MYSITAVCCLLALLHGDARPSPTTRVRGVTPSITKVLDEAIRRSPTIVTLMRAIEHSDVIVHVEEVLQLPPRTEGRLMFSVATGGVRYLRVQVLSSMPTAQMISTIGHELQHAVEIAEHQEVRSTAGFIALYERIGERGHRGQYDTAAARSAGQKVRNEITE
jgi:hypothetical protein